MKVSVTMIKIFKYMKAREWLFFGFAVVFIILGVWLDLRMPEYMATVSKMTQTPGSQPSQIWGIGVGMLFCALGSLVSNIIVGYLLARMSANYSMELRQRMFNKTLSFSAEEMGRFSTASLITRSTNDIMQIQTLITLGLASIVKAPILAVWAFLKIMGRSWELTLATGIAILLIMLIVGVLVLFAMPKYSKVQTLTDKLNRVTMETLTGLRVVRAYNAQGYQEAKFERVSDDLVKNNLFAAQLMAIMQPSMSLIMSGLSLGIYWIGAGLINAAQGGQRLTYFADIVVFSAYAVQIVMAFMTLSRTFFLLPRVSVSARRIHEVLNTSSPLVDGDIQKNHLPKRGEVEFQNVSFKYPGAQEYCLHHINFKIKGGETLAIIGATGSGKTTLINLIPRFYDATEGEVLVEGVNVQKYRGETLNNKLGYVSQQAVLFSGTVKSNIAYGNNGNKEILEQNVAQAAAIAQATEFVEQMTGGINAPVARGGSNLSGGQKQRISIARAINRKPEILIFDDSFSALDYKTDQKLRGALKKNAASSTVIIVAQRIGTVRDADKIIVLDEGTMVGMGTHDELMLNCPTYQAIAYSQLSKEELKHA